jgi:ABC-type polysaccharide/polyol phosphate transport system ATPase subunit
MNRLKKLERENIQLKKGKIVASGTVEEIIEKYEHHE